MSEGVLECPDYSRKAPANHKARLFVEKYLLCKNAIESCKGIYNNPSAAAKRLMSSKTIKEYIEHRISEDLKQVRLSKDDFLVQVRRDLENAKSEATRARLRQLQADVLGFTKPQEQGNQINIFQALKDASQFISAKALNPSNGGAQEAIVAPQQALSGEVLGTDKDTLSPSGEVNIT
jgi:hypothetical protein